MSEYEKLKTKYEILGQELESKLHLVQIYFDTATFDKIERDQAVKFEAQLGLVGGTMGLLTGFSIISGIEIIFFLFRLTNAIQIFVSTRLFTSGWSALSTSGRSQGLTLCLLCKSKEDLTLRSNFLSQNLCLSAHICDISVWNHNRAFTFKII